MFNTSILMCQSHAIDLILNTSKGKNLIGPNWSSLFSIRYNVHDIFLNKKTQNTDEYLFDSFKLSFLTVPVMMDEAMEVLEKRKVTLEI